MKTNHLSFAKTFGRKPRSKMRKLEREVDDRLPDVKRAAEVYGYDSDFDRLFLKDTGAFVEAGDHVKLDGVLFAVWRVKSAVVLGTVDGLPRNLRVLVGLEHKLASLRKKPPKPDPLSPPRGIQIERNKRIRDYERRLQRKAERKARASVQAAQADDNNNDGR